MRRISCTLLFLSLFLSACSSSGFSPEAPPPALPTYAHTVEGESPTSDVLPVITSEVLPHAKLIATLATPHIEQGPDGPRTDSSPVPEECGYQWAYQDLPELSSDFLQSLQQLQPEAQGNAYVFGENCIRPDGSVARFLPMETDFNITLQVSDLANESDLGQWIVKVMQIIESLPPEEIIGRRPGRISMIFQSNGEQKAVTFYIDQYHALPEGLSNAEIFQRLQAPQ
jgi:hypothetical protein